MNRRSLHCLKLCTHWSVTVSFCQFSDWQLLISCVFGSNWTLYFVCKFLSLLLLPILLPNTHELRSFQSLNGQKLTVTDHCMRGFSGDMCSHKAERNSSRGLTQRWSKRAVSLSKHKTIRTTHLREFPAFFSHFGPISTTLYQAQTKVRPHLYQHLTKSSSLPRTAASTPRIVSLTTFTFVIPFNRSCNVAAQAMLAK